MYIGYDEKQEALRKELRDYYNELLTPEIRDALAAEEAPARCTERSSARWAATAG